VTRVLILAAGQGTRLRPLTNDKPKCLVPLLGRPLLEWQTDTLLQAGLTDINIVTGYRGEMIESLGYSTSINPFYDKTNMVESLFSAMDFMLKGGDLIIAYGDIVYQYDNLMALLSCNDEIALMIDENWRDLWSLRIEDPLDDAETLKIDGQGYITEVGKKPQSYDQIEGQYTGLIKIRSDKLVDLVEFYTGLDRGAYYDGKDFNNMYLTSFLQLLIDGGWHAKAVLVRGGWLEVDSVADLALYEGMERRGVLESFYKVLL